MNAKTTPPPRRAVLFATGRAARDLPVPADTPAALLPLGHATLAERLIEQLVRVGATEIDVVAGDRPEALRQELGDGERWGVHLHWHLAKANERAYAVLKSAAIATADRVLIGHADSWIDPAALRQLAASDALVFALDATDAFAWTGWACVPGTAFAPLRSDADERSLAALLAVACPRKLVLERTLAFRPLDAVTLLAAQKAVVAGSADAPLPETWIPTAWGAVSPGATVHPRATIVGPVLIGPGCLVDDGATVGPNTVLTDDVIVSAGTTVRDSIVLPRTYLGRGLDVAWAVVNGGRIRHAALGVETTLPASDALALNLAAPAKPGPTLVGRISAAAGAALLSPLVALGALLRSHSEPVFPWTTTATVVGLDASRRIVTGTLRLARAEKAPLRRAAAWVGGLLDIAQGRRCWFGVRARRTGEWYALSAEWQTLLASSPIGIINAPAWSGDSGSRLEALAAADAFYVVRRGWKENLRLVLAALRSPRATA